MNHSNDLIGKGGKVGVIGGVLLFVVATVVFAQATRESAAPVQASPFSISKVFAVLYLKVGPLKIIAPFVKMTKGHDRTFKRKLAFRGILIAALAMLAAVTTGVKTLVGWGVSLGALLMTAGIVLFLVALQPVLEQYKPQAPAAELPEPPKAQSVTALAFSPLAFPTIIPPYGVAVLVLLATLRPDHLPEIFAVMGFVLVLNLLAMLFADFILESTVVATLLQILGAVVGVLQIALGAQAAVDGLRQMGVV